MTKILTTHITQSLDKRLTVVKILPVSELLTCTKNKLASMMVEIPIARAVGAASGFFDSM